MAMIVVLQMLLFSIAMAQSGDGEPADSVIFLTLSGRSFSPITTCLLRSQPVVQRDDYTYTPGIGGHKVHTQAATWHSARRTCEEEGGHLAIVNSIAESNAITNLLQNSGRIAGATGNPDWVFIGFHDLFQEGEYVTVHGQSLAKAGFTQWAAGQPDNGFGGENCGSVHKNGGLNDLRCAAKYGFVCELPNY